MNITPTLRVKIDDPQNYVLEFKPVDAKNWRPIAYVSSPEALKKHILEELTITAIEETRQRVASEFEASGVPAILDVLPKKDGKS